MINSIGLTCFFDIAEKRYKKEGISINERNWAVRSHPTHPPSYATGQTDINIRQPTKKSKLKRRLWLDSNPRKNLQWGYKSNAFNR